MRPNVERARPTSARARGGRAVLTIHCSCDQSRTALISIPDEARRGDGIRALGLMQEMDRDAVQRRVCTPLVVARENRVEIPGDEEPEELAAVCGARTSEELVEQDEPWTRSTCGTAVVSRDRREHRKVQHHRTFAGRQSLDPRRIGGNKARPVAVRDVDDEAMPVAGVE